MYQFVFWTGWSHSAYRKRVSDHSNYVSRAALFPFRRRDVAPSLPIFQNVIILGGISNRVLKLTNMNPIWWPQYKTPFALREEMKSQVERTISKAIITQQLPRSAAALLLNKRSSDGKSKVRFCVDFRAVNAVTKFDSYPLPVFQETTSTLFGCK